MAEPKPADSPMMTTREVAAYLRIKERKVYELIKAGRIPCRRVTGKWLFPKRDIDAWLTQGAHLLSGGPAPGHPPAVIAGSHDPLLEWSVRESGCALAMLAGGSVDGLDRFVAGEALVCGLHLIDPESGEYNLPALGARSEGQGVVMIEWARREQGLVLSPGNPLGITGLADLVEKKARVIKRQPEAGSQVLLAHLLSEAGIAETALNRVSGPALTEGDLAEAISEGKADAGLGVRAAAHQHHLDFLPLHWERYDFVIRRRDYFEPPFQRLLAFCRGAAFAARAAELEGYDCAGLGRVVFNGS